MDDRDKRLAFLACLLRDVIIFGPDSINLNELQALDNIIEDLPEVTSNDFRW